MGINSAAPPLADDIYMFVCHGFGSARERFIVRMGMALNQALYDENKGKEGWVEQLGYAMLSIHAGAALHRLVAELQLKSRHSLLSSCHQHSLSSGLSREGLQGLHSLQWCQAE